MQTYSGFKQTNDRTDAFWLAHLQGLSLLPTNKLGTARMIFWSRPRGTGQAREKESRKSFLPAWNQRDDWTKRAPAGPIAVLPAARWNQNNEELGARTATSDGAGQRSSCRRINFFDGSGILSVDTNL